MMLDWHKPRYEDVDPAPELEEGQVLAGGVVYEKRLIRGVWHIYADDDWFSRCIDEAQADTYLAARRVQAEREAS